MYLPITNPMEKGDLYYVVSSNASLLIRPEDEEYKILEFKAKEVTKNVCYGESIDNGDIKIHKLKKVYRTKVQALIELRKLYLKKEELFKKHLEEVQTKLTLIAEELPYV